MYVHTTMEEVKWCDGKHDSRCKGRDSGGDVNALSYSQHAKQPSIWKERERNKSVREADREREAIPVPDQKGAEEGGTKL